VDTTGVKRKSKTLNKKINLPTVNVWRVKEPHASEYLDQEIIKFVSFYFNLTLERLTLRQNLTKEEESWLLQMVNFSTTSNNHSKCLIQNKLSSQKVKCHNS
jgi:hypothetical protein